MAMIRKSGGDAGSDCGGGKEERILRAARDAFLEQGYERTSMDTVARKADVSKTTLYAHFPGKEKLFLAVFEAERLGMGLPDACSIPKSAVDIRASLRANARALLDKMTSQGLMGLFRMTLAESGRSPELGRAIWEDGPARGTGRMTGLMAHFMAAGQLRSADPHLAASRFLSLVYGGLHVHCLLDSQFRPSSEELQGHVEQCLDFFLAYYGPEGREQIPQSDAADKTKA
jgi:TetR/AcrR family transcriptional regulator, mexJK operon transcriptional repressor